MVHKDVTPQDAADAAKRRENPTPNVPLRYGAPMGRPTRSQDCVGKVTLRKIKLDSGGYDPGGAYWGIGQTLYWAGDESGALDLFFRAPGRAAAKQHILGIWPDATFYR